MLERLSGETRLFPIIGDPVIYARAPEILTRNFAARGRNAVCIPMQVPDGALDDAMRGDLGSTEHRRPARHHAA